MSKDSDYDWASAIATLATSQSHDFTELAALAKLDPLSGDFADADFSGLDLSGQNLTGWDLRNAKFVNCRMTSTELRGARVDPKELIEAVNWEAADLDDNTRAAAQEAAHARANLLSTRLEELELSVRTTNTLKNADILLVGDLVRMSEPEVLRIKDFGRKSLMEVKELLSQMNLHLGLEISETSYK